MLDAAAANDALAHIDQFIQAGRLDEADSLCRDLVQRDPGVANGWLRLGLVSSWRNSYAAAEDAFRRALALVPTEPGIWNQLSIAVNKQGRGADAEPFARQAIQLDPRSAAHWSSLGDALSTEHRWTEAAAALQQSLAIDPHDAAVWNNFGNAQLKLRQVEAAEAAFQHSLALAPSNIGATSNYAFLLCQLDRRDEATRLLQAAIVRDPLVPQSWALLGEMWQMMAEWGLAEAASRRVLDLLPQDAAAQYQVARMLRSQRHFAQAEQTVRDLLTRHPEHADAYALLGEVLSAQGRSHEGVAFARQAVEQAPGNDRHGRLLTALQYDDATGPDHLLTAHRAWDAAYARPLLPAQPAIATKRAAAAPLRIGFLSSDFGRHPTAFLVLPALERLDRNACSVVCYSDRTHEDEFSARFRAAAAQWRVTYRQSDDDVAAQIRKDNIDILVDLMGHNGKRLLVFARQPAPVQVTWFGYVGTTGLTAMDYLLADRFHVRTGEEPWYSESVLRMPHGYACYGPPADAPPVGPLPALSTGHITFGCFNNAAKYSPRLLEAWATILHRLPNARLLLKTGALGDIAVQQRLREHFAARGIEAERIFLEGWSPQAELLASYNRADLALDTQPYSGGLTTCEALWMGVPAITFPGKTFAGRHSTSHMTNAGYAQFVAADLEGYIDLAVEWADRLDELAALRAQMREQVRQSPLCDAPCFAADLLTVLAAAERGSGAILFGT